MSKPFSMRITVIPTFDCNLACEYCNVKKNTEYMSLDTADDIIAWISNFARDNQTLSVLRIVFFGGEPLLAKDIMIYIAEKLREKIKNIKFAFAFSTNGTLINENDLKKFRRYNFDIQLSLDGKRRYNKERKYKNGKESFDDVISKIPLLLKYFPNAIGKMTVTEYNVKHIYENFLYLRSFGFRIIGISPIHTFFFKVNAVRNYFEEKKRVYNYVLEKIRGSERIILIPEYIFLRKYVFKIHRNDKNTVWPCGAGERNIGVDHRGYIYFCASATANALRKNNKDMQIGHVSYGINKYVLRKLLPIDKTKSYRKKIENLGLDAYIVACPFHNKDFFGNIFALDKRYVEFHKLLKDTLVNNFFIPLKRENLLKKYLSENLD